jgi:MFS family permease
VNTPSLSSLISQAGEAGEQGGILGISQALSSLARIVGPAWGGFAYDHLGIGSPYLTASGLLALAFLVSFQGAGRAVAPRPSGR